VAKPSAVTEVVVGGGLGHSRERRMLWVFGMLLILFW